MPRTFQEEQQEKALEVLDGSISEVLKAFKGDSLPLALSWMGFHLLAGQRVILSARVEEGPGSELPEVEARKLEHAGLTEGQRDLLNRATNDTWAYFYTFRDLKTGRMPQVKTWKSKIRNSLVCMEIKLGSFAT